MAEDRKRRGQPGEDGDHNAAGLIRQAWSLREASGMHEVDPKGRDAPRPEKSLGASVARGEVGPMRPAAASTGEKMKRQRSRQEGVSREASSRPENAGEGPGGEPGKRR